MPNPKKLLGIGVLGAALTVLCCFSPILIVLLGAVGLAALSGYLDYVLMPALVVFIGVIVYAVWLERRAVTLSTKAKRS